MGLYCTVRVADLWLGLDVDDVQEVLRPQHVTRVPLADSVVRGLINLRGEIVTAVDLGRRFGLPDREHEEGPMNVVVRTGDGRAISVLVDSIGDVIEVPETAFEEPPVTLVGAVRELVKSVCKMQDGLLLILDTHEATTGTHRRPRSDT
ncbi:MAG: chemotaxis protein CheW [Sandaracinaceae bacterium]